MASLANIVATSTNIESKFFSPEVAVKAYRDMCSLIKTHAFSDLVDLELLAHATKYDDARKEEMADVETLEDLDAE